MSNAFNVNAFNELNRVVSQFVLGISGDEIMARGQLLDAVPSMELAGPGASIFLEGTKDYSGVTAAYTGYGAPSTGVTPSTPTEVELAAGGNNEHTDIAYQETINVVRAVAAAGGMTDAAYNYAQKIAGQLDEVRQLKLHRQHLRLDTALTTGAVALGTAIDAGADGHVVLKAMFRTATIDTLILREDGLDAFLDNAKIKEAIGASNAAQAVSQSAFEQYLNDHFGRFAPWADGIKLYVDSLRVVSDHSGDYRMSNAMIGLRTRSSQVQGGRANPTVVQGKFRLPIGACQTYIRPGITDESNPQDGTLLSQANPNLSDMQRALNFSLEHIVERIPGRRIVRHYLHDTHGAYTLRANGLYVRTGVVT